MKFIIILLLICVLSGLPLVLRAEDEWFAATSNVIRIRCYGFDHNVEIAWTKSGTLALSIHNTEEGSVRISENEAVYRCTAQVYNGSKLLAGFHLSVDATSVFSPDENRELLKNVILPQKSTVKCRSDRSKKPNFVFDWANAVYSSESRRTTIFGYFNGTLDVDKSGDNEFTCSEESGSEIRYDNIRVTWEKILPPVIRLNPSKQVVTIDESTDVACEVIGNDPASSIEWYSRDGTPELNFLGHSNLYFRNISIQAAGEYFCVARNAAGWSKEAKLVVETISCS